MSKSDELAAKAARLKEARAQKSVSSDGGTEVRTAGVSRSEAPAGPRVRPVRLTVDVPPSDHAELQRWCLEAAAELGVARVHGQELVRTLLARTLADPAARAAVIDEVAAARAAT